MAATNRSRRTHEVDLADSLDVEDLLEELAGYEKKALPENSPFASSSRAGRSAVFARVTCHPRDGGEKVDHLFARKGVGALFWIISATDRSATTHARSFCGEVDAHAGVARL